MIFLFTEIDHPAVFQGRGTPEADHILASQFFFIEEILTAHKVLWSQRTPSGVLAILEAGETAYAALDIQKQFASRPWDPFDPGKVRIVLHSGEADQYGQTYVGPDVNHALKLLETAWGGQILLTVPAVHFIPLPPGARLQDLGAHFLKDLSEPGNVHSLLHPDLPSVEFPPLRSLGTYPQNFFPQLSPFFGRQEEIGELTVMLARSPVRQVTLVGPGGFGKTRLAFQTSAEVVDRFKDGAFWVSLAPVLSGSLIFDAIAAALKLFFYGPEDPKIQLLNHLKPKECLIVLDNFEQLMEGAGLISEILRAAPGVKILVTSRESLGTEEESAFEVRGLRYPEEGAEGPLEAYAACQLFLKSARRVRPGFLWEAGDAPPLIRICHLLEGMPLGLEISASWVSSLTLNEIAGKIESSRDVLATSMPYLPPRHRSLRAVFEYSWILLSAPQKKALSGISVFRGGFTLPAARKVAGATESVLGTLEAKSLVRKRADGRFEIHELLKHFAKEKLFDDPAWKVQAMDAHSAFFCGVLKNKEKDLFGPNQRKVFAELVLEKENIREGWNLAVEGVREKELGQYLDTLFTLFETKGWNQEGLEVFRRAAGALQGKYPDPSTRPARSSVLLGKLISRWGQFEFNLGRNQEAQGLFEGALGLLEGASAKKQSGFALAGLGLAAGTRGEFKKARDYFTRSYRAYRKSGQRSGTTLVLNHLGHLATRMGNLPRALAFIRQSLRFSEKDRDERAKAYSYALTGDVLCDLGRFREARVSFQKSLDSYSRSDDPKGTAWALRNLGRTAGVLGDYEGARQMYLESLAMARRVGDRRAVEATLNELGYIGWALGEYREAEEFLREALDLFRASGDPGGMAWSLDLMANLSLAQGDDRKAEENYRQAHELLLKMGLRGSGQAWYFFHQGDLESFRGHWSGARNFFRKSLACFEEAGNRLGITEASIKLGESACRLKAHPEAGKIFRRAARIALGSQMIPQLVELAIGVARLLDAQGDTRQAAGFVLAALAHPTCRRPMKDKTASFMKDLQAGFPGEEWEGFLQWAKKARIEELVTAWASSDRSPRRRKKSRVHSPKGRKSKTKKHKI